VKPSVKRERLSEPQWSIEIDSDEETSGLSSGVALKQETKVPTPPLRQVASAPSQLQSSLAQTHSLPPSQLQSAPAQTHSLPPSQQTAHQSSMYRRFGNPKPASKDEHAKKRQREAELMVKKLNRPQSYSCGISYQGDEKEKDFSDGIKSDLKNHLPSLKNHRHFFHYMAWATTERLECDHCRKCPNVFS